INRAFFNPKPEKPWQSRFQRIPAPRSRLQSIGDAIPPRNHAAFQVICSVKEISTRSAQLFSVYPRHVHLQVLFETISMNGLL
uniref:Uncharacterized protein n=1 Tax=Aegilops tauschii subsp. strangulata TaxID=200361 RepID=A0A453BV23_AEGTS